MPEKLKLVMLKIQEIREISHAKMPRHAGNVAKNGRIKLVNAQPKANHAGNATSQTILQSNVFEVSLILKSFNIIKISQRY